MPRHTKTCVDLPRTRGKRPRVLLIDDEFRDSHRELAGALRRHHMQVVRVVPPGSPAPTTLGSLVDRLTFGPSVRLSHPILGASEESVEVRRQLLAPPTVDVHAPEHISSHLVTTAEWAAEPALAKVRPSLPIEMLYDKLAITRLAASVGVGVPETWTNPTSDTFPVVVKGREGFGGRQVRVARDAAELAEAWQELTAGDPTRAFVQAFHPGGVTSSGGVSREGCIISFSCWRVFPATDDPLGPPVRIAGTQDQPVLTATETLIEALGYTGMFNLNFVRDADGAPLLIDLNCRVFGSWQAVQAAGLDVMEAYAAVYAGTPAPPRHTLLTTGESPVVRVGKLDDGSVGSLLHSSVATSATVWSRHGVLGWRWALATQLRLGGAFARSAVGRLRRT